jgi:hypothetical protein
LPGPSCAVLSFGDVIREGVLVDHDFDEIGGMGEVRIAEYIVQIGFRGNPFVIYPE